MGISLSNSQVAGEIMTSRNGATEREEFDGPEVKGKPLQIDESRLFQLLQALQQISKLQEEAVNAQIDVRQKMREVGLKRQAVWSSDAAFMGELQARTAQGRLERSQELIRLAADCQTARDGLGPLEQEGIEAEQHWEGIIWKLRQEEQNLYQGFRNEFQSSISLPPPTSTESSAYEPSSETDSQNDDQDTGPKKNLHHYVEDSEVSSSSFALPPSAAELLLRASTEMLQNTTLLGMNDTPMLPGQFNVDVHTWDADSGIGDIDRLPETVPDSIGPAYPIRHGPHSGIELYPHLLTDFSSRRDRINKWLQHTALISRFEATLLKDQLELENPSIPSNWSQLIIAYWELDEATKPSVQHAKQSIQPSQHGTLHSRKSKGHKNQAHGESPTRSGEVVKPKLWSPASSDLRTRSRESLKSLMMPLRQAPKLPQLRSKSDVGESNTNGMPTDSNPP